MLPVLALRTCSGLVVRGVISRDTPDRIVPRPIGIAPLPSPLPFPLSLPLSLPANKTKI